MSEISEFFEDSFTEGGTEYYRVGNLVLILEGDGNEWEASLEDWTAKETPGAKPERFGSSVLWDDLCEKQIEVEKDKVLIAAIKNLMRVVQRCQKELEEKS